MGVIMVAEDFVSFGMEGVEGQQRVVDNVCGAARGRVRGASVNYRLQVRQAVNGELVAAARRLGVPVEELARACFEMGLGLFATACADLSASGDRTIKISVGFSGDWVRED
jgi:hypothetical protein